MRDAGYFVLFTVGIFFIVYFIFDMLVPAFYPEAIPPLVRNWIVTVIYLSVIGIFFRSPDEWYRDPTFKGLKDVEETLEEFRSELSFWKEIESTQDDLFEEIERLDDKMGIIVRKMSGSSRRGNLKRFADQLADLSEEVRGLKRSMKGSVSRIEGIDFQDWSAQMFRNLGFEVKNQVYSDSDHALSLEGELVGVVSAKNWTLKDRNRTVNDSRLGPELKRAREAKIPLIVHVYNKKTDRNWFHIFDPDDLKDPVKTTPNWLREEDLSEEQEEKMRKNYEEFHEVVNEIITG